MFFSSNKRWRQKASLSVLRMTLNFARNDWYTWGQDQLETQENSLAGIAWNSTRAKTCTLTRKIRGTGTDWRTTGRTACTSTEVESKQSMDEQRTLAAMNPNRKQHWINKNPANGLRKGNNCWTTPGTLTIWGPAVHEKQCTPGRPAKIHQENLWKGLEHLWGQAEHLFGIQES